jgi:hypothetical protein
MSGATGVSGAGAGGTAGASNGGLSAGGTGGSSGAAGSANGGAAGASAGAGGATAGAAGRSGGSAGGDGKSAACAEAERIYAEELARLLECTPGAGNQCQEEREAVPGCDCQAAVQPRDPFSLENLTNLQEDWFALRCPPLPCPVTCNDGAPSCQQQSGSSLGGRCVRAP